MNTYRISEIQADESFKDELLLDPLFLVEPADVPVGKSVIDAIVEWEFDTLMSNAQRSALAVVKEHSEGGGAPAPKKTPIKVTTEDVSLDDFLGGGSQKVAAKTGVPPSMQTRQTREQLQQASQKPVSQKTASQNPVAQKSAAAASSAPKPGDVGSRQNPSVATSKSATPQKPMSPAARIEAVRNTYSEYEKYINTLFTRYATHNDMNRAELVKKVEELCLYIQENKPYMLRVVPTDAAFKGNFFVSHTMRSTVIAIAIALEMRLGTVRTVELGTACILHEIGMLKLPPQVYASNKALTTSERALIETHSTKGAAIAGILGFSDSIKNGIEDHHECKNGTGYPNRKMGERISTYGKIIAVACSYEAITAPRKYKPQRSSFEAMVEMLKNKDGRYDETVIKALLYSLSLFPIGAFVFLADGRIAEVTDVNPADPVNPIVQLLNERDERGMPLIVQTGAKMKISRVLTREEVYDAIKNMKR